MGPAKSKEPRLAAVLAARPPDYAVTAAPVDQFLFLEGSVIILTMAGLRPELGDLDGLYRRLQGSLPACSLMVAAPPDDADRLRDLLAVVPGWRGVPLVEVRGGELSPNSLRVALSTTRDLVPGLVNWLSTVRPRSGRCQAVLRTLLDAPIRKGAAESMAGSGYARRTVARRLDAAGLPPPGRLRTMLRVIRFSLALQEPARPTIEQVAFRFGYADGSRVSHLIMDHLALRVDEVRTVLGWKWIAARFLSTRS